MFNPLLANPADLKDAELEEKIIELSRKYSIAARTGMNQVIPQIIVVLNTYREEMAKRNVAALQGATKKNSGNLDDLINVE
jgi:hypothetical protein